MRPRAALEGKRDTARTCAPLAGHGAGALERVSPLERARGGTGLAEALERGGWRRGTVRLHVRWADSPDSHTLCSRPCRDERVVRDQSVSTYIRREILAPGVYSHTTAETTVRRQATGQVVVVVWWWCKIRETARLAANGALL